MEIAHQVLRDVFGHESFRLSQEAVGIHLKYLHGASLRQNRQVIKRLLVDGENALVLYPTGGSYRIRRHLVLVNDSIPGGKSLTYQVPALCLKVCSTTTLSRYINLIV